MKKIVVQYDELFTALFVNTTRRTRIHYFLFGVGCDVNHHCPLIHFTVPLLPFSPVHEVLNGLGL